MSLGVPIACFQNNGFMSTKLHPYVLIAVAAIIVGYAIHARRTERITRVNADTLPQPQAFETIRPSSSTKVGRPPSVAETFELPEGDLAKLNGTGGLDSENCFTCILTNQSQWFVTDVRFYIATGNPEGSLSWERTYREAVQLGPRKVARISFKVIDTRDVETRWRITAARGYPPE